MQHLQQLILLLPLLLLLQPAKNCFIKCFLLASPYPCISNAFMLMSFEPGKAAKENKPKGSQRTNADGKSVDVFNLQLYFPIKVDTRSFQLF